MAAACSPSNPTPDAQTPTDRSVPEANAGNDAGSDIVAMTDGATPMDTSSGDESSPVMDGGTGDAGAMDVPVGPVDAAPDVIDVALPSLDATVTPGDAAAGTCALSNDEPVLNNPGDSRFVSLVWTGTEFGAAWEDNEVGNDEIYFARIAADGTVLGHAQLTDDPNDDAHASLAFDGTGYAVAWSDTPGDGTSTTTPGAIRFARIPSDVLTTAGDGGVAALPYVSVTAADQPGVAQPSLVALPASAGGGFAVAWEDGRNGATNHEIYYARLDAAGHAAAEVRFTNAPAISYYPLLAWNSARSELGMVWLDARDDAASAYPNEALYFARILPSGTRPAGASDVRVSHVAYRSIWPSVTYDGTGYGVGWANEDSIPDAPHIFFEQLDADGAPRGSAGIRQVSHNPEGVGAWANGVAFNGSEYLIVWEDQRHAMGDLAVERIAPDGTQLTDEVFLHHDAFFTSHPSLVRAGANWGVAWEDERAGERDIYFRAIGRTDCLTSGSAM